MKYLCSLISGFFCQHSVWVSPGLLRVAVVLSFALLGSMCCGSDHRLFIGATVSGYCIVFWVGAITQADMNILVHVSRWVQWATLHWGVPSNPCLWSFHWQHIFLLCRSQNGEGRRGDISSSLTSLPAAGYSQPRQHVSPPLRTV